uniref:Uncharacterized protein n=1 Tax=Anguilla anguilla TaxID=7936 RepID=A0A0E9XPM1_ANGAN
MKSHTSYKQSTTTSHWLAALLRKRCFCYLMEPSMPLKKLKCSFYILTKAKH